MAISKNLLKFSVNIGAKTLAEYLKKSTARATYSSKTTQKHLIEYCGLEITEKILENVKNSGYNRIMFDETSYVSHKSEIRISLHHVHDQLRKFNIPLSMCMGIGTDSCSVMMSEQRGAIVTLYRRN